MLRDSILMLSQWLASPAAIGALVPSSAPLTKAMARAVTAVPPGTIMMLGGGTGAIASALLAAGVALENLVLVERNNVLYRRLVTRFPGVRIVSGDAANTKLLAAAVGESAVTAIVSGLPLLAMEREEIRAILHTVTLFLSVDGVFAQYTYGRASPVSEYLMREFGLEGQSLGRVWLNFPPATVWRYRRQLIEPTPFTGTPRPALLSQDELAGA